MTGDRRDQNRAAISAPGSDLELTHALADAARAPCLRHFRSAGLQTSNKAASGAYDPVTAADREAETAMRALLAAHRPKDGVQGEEHGRMEGESGRFWVLDPVDGTRAFVFGAPTWGVLIALNDGARPVLGMMDQPFVGERFWGDGKTAWRMSTRAGDDRHPAPIHASAVTALGAARLCSTFPEVGSPEERLRFERVRDRVRLTRYGLDCSAYALLAAGHVDLVIEAGLQPHDIQALIPLVQGAGGRLTTWDGGDAQHGGRAIAAATPELHAAAMALLAD